jgi:inner membrane protein
MDSLTQALLGAAVQGSLLGRFQGRKALLYGAALGTLPDLDVLIDFGDAVGQMTYHRGFSHSIFLISGFSLLLAWLVRRFRPETGYGMQRLFACVWLVLATHVFIDTCTTYGTQVFWPLPVAPANLSNIFVIDPLYSLPLLVGVLLALFIGLTGAGWRALNWALGLSSLYMLSSFASQAVMTARFDAALRDAGIGTEQRLVMPTPGNTVLWRLLALDGERYCEGLSGWFDRKAPELVCRPRGLELREVVSDGAAHQRLSWFNSGYMAYREERGQLVATDLRLGLLGSHSFQFVLARRDGTGQWQRSDWIEGLPMSFGSAESRTQLWRRLWGDEGDFSVLLNYRPEVD